MAPRRERKEPPVEVDRVRFLGRRLASGLFRHRSVRFIFEIGKRRRKRGP
jgi:hypothetical protein